MSILAIGKLISFLPTILALFNELRGMVEAEQKRKISEAISRGRSGLRDLNDRVS